MTLFVVPTPIGNLADITLRALETLRGSNLILCENTRASQVLLRAYEIAKPLWSLHKFNERARQEAVLTRLKRNEVIALISSAGTPAVCDPGQRLISACLSDAIAVEVLPGPCALITALVASGFHSPPFQFIGFIARRPVGQLRDLLKSDSASVGYLSPRSVRRTLESIVEIDPERQVFLIKEMTKVFEAHYRGTPAQVLAHLEDTAAALRGEWTLVIAAPAGRSPVGGIARRAGDRATSPAGASKGRLIGALAKELGIGRQELYRHLTTLE